MFFFAQSVKIIILSLNYPALYPRKFSSRNALATTTSVLLS